MRTASISDPPSCAASMFSSPCSRSSQGASFGRNLYAWLRRVLTLPTEPGDAVRRPSGERLSYCDADTRNAVDSVDVVVRDDKPKKQRTSGELLAAAAAAASTATSTGTSQVTVTTQQTRSPPSLQSSKQQPAVRSESSKPRAAGGGASAGGEGKAVAHEKREISMRNYVIGGLSFEVDSRYKIKSIVGKGAYGLVCAAEDLCPLSPKEETSPKAAESGAPPAPPPAEKTGPAMVAVKKVIDPFHDHTDCKRLLREIRLLRSMRHPNVLHLTDIMPAKSPAPSDWKDVYLVTRLFDTNLHRVIYSGHALTDAHIQYILWQVFRALRYLHAAGVVHRDMKPTNLLLNRDCELALADFGLARHMPNKNAAGAMSPAATSPTSIKSASSDELGTAEAEEKSKPMERSKNKAGQLTRYVVTRWYRAPELLVQNRQYDCKVDMWSTGCILAEVLGAKAIFPGKDSLHQLRLVVELLGLPSDEELGTITNAQAVSYIRNLRPKENAATDPGAAAGRFAKLYPHASPLLLDLMARLLQFDPRKRPTADEALAHPYLAAYKDAPEEGLPTPEVEMAFEADSPSTDELRMLIWDEVLRYHPQLKAGAAPAHEGQEAAI